jgi:hypothetical protein
MLALQRKHPEIYAEFAKGNFTVRKTDSKFSNIAIDQEKKGQGVPNLG